MSILQQSIDAIGNDDFGTNDKHAMSADKPSLQSSVTDLVKVNTTVAGAQFAPAVAALSGGGYVIVWEDASAGRIFAQRFSAVGVKVGNELQLDSTQGGSALWVSVAATANDGFVIAFQAGSFAQAEIFGRRYDGANAPVGGLFAVNSTSPNEQFNPHVACSMAAICCSHGTRRPSMCFRKCADGYFCPTDRRSGRILWWHRYRRTLNMAYPR